GNVVNPEDRGLRRLRPLHRPPSGGPLTDPTDNSARLFVGERIAPACRAQPRRRGRRAKDVTEDTRVRTDPAPTTGRWACGPCSRTGTAPCGRYAPTRRPRRSRPAPCVRPRP